ncbi:MAG: DUF1080 domain-containing protein [Planctomycetales bacterium]|nr:DUF1080 domain-containing protein [Planctomycetales bacterium]
MKHCLRLSIAALSLALLGLTAPAAHAESPADEAGFKSLFDGESLKGWAGKEQFWSVRDGAITGQTTAENPTKGNTFLIWQDGKLGDFELRLKFRIVGGNSGIQYRSEELPDFVVKGYQADFEAGTKYIGICYEERGRGILALRGQKVTINADGSKDVAKEPTCDEEKMLASINKEGWNDYVITAKGNHLVQKINGFTTVDITDNQSDKAAKSGILALQLHAGPPMVVQFKDIRVKQ